MGTLDAVRALTAAAFLMSGCATPSRHGHSVSVAERAVLPQVDHVVYATRDLQTSITKLEELLGVRASFGGKHPGGGTQNALIALGPGMYLEIMAPDPDQPDPPRGRPFGIDTLREPHVVAWLAKGKDLPTLIAGARAHGVALGDLREGRRQRPDGAQLSWRFTDPWVSVGDGIVPVFIDWGASPHPSEVAAQGASLLGMRAEHPQPDKVKVMLDALGVRLHVGKGTQPALILTIQTPHGVVELR